ncbi:hypothetical protein ABZ413_24555 [Nocardia rhamnosiphila]|uniref:TetR/AcrR family transcriptional regulator n=1 Tax=Nocardia rhamnosiphila TaxID=426716 RepID=UPI0033EBA9A1
MSGINDDPASPRERILRAAHDVFVELGALASLDQVVDRADVDTDTFDRLFPGRDSLIKAVVVHNMTQLSTHARAARKDQRDPWTAFRHFAYAIVEDRVVALLITLGSHARRDEQFVNARSEVGDELGLLLAAARKAGLRGDVDVGDIVLYLSVITRPNLAVPAGLDARARARLLDVMLDGLRADGSTPLAGEPITEEDVDTTLMTAHWHRRAL